MVLIYSELNLVSICWTGKFLLLFHSLSNLIRLHEMLCPDHWRLASSQERHIIVLLLGKLTWNYDKWAPQLSWRRHQLYTLVALVVCALLLWTIPAPTCPETRRKEERKRGREEAKPSLPLTRSPGEWPLWRHDLERGVAPLGRLHWPQAYYCFINKFICISFFFRLHI